MSASFTSSSRSSLTLGSSIPHRCRSTRVIPGLEIHSWRELIDFSQKERELILKISGFSEIGWGSRSVILGSDVAHGEWKAAVQRALEDSSASSVDPAALSQRPAG